MPTREGRTCTIVIPTYNQSEYVGAAVASSVNQSCPADVLVSIDASPDDTAHTLEKLQQSLAFTVHNHAVNLGISAHLRWLFQQPRTPYIARLDSDDLLHPGFVCELSALLDRHPRAGYAHCAVLEIDSKGHERRVRRLARTNEFESAESALKRSLKGYMVSANILMFRREALAAVGYGPGSAQLNFVEDYDMSIRIADAGWGNAYCPKVLASYRMWEGASRPVIGRKLQEVRGVYGVFAGSLSSAFAKRNWSDRPLQRRRLQVALDNSEILDRGAFAAGERAQMVEALMTLAGNPAYRFAFSDHLPARWFRRMRTNFGGAQTALRHTVKGLLFRGR